MKQLLRFDFVRFCLVGGTGFIINFALLTVFYKHLHMPLFIAQLLAAEIALFNNFTLHHYWTYGQYNGSKRKRELIVQFHLSSWMGIIGTALLLSAGVKLLHLNYLVALTLSSALAMFWNFSWAKFVIWRSSEVAASAEFET